MHCAMRYGLKARDRPAISTRGLSPQSDRTVFVLAPLLAGGIYRFGWLVGAVESAEAGERR